MTTRTCTKCSKPIGPQGKTGVCLSCLNTKDVLRSRWKQARAIHVAVYRDNELVKELTDNGDNEPIILNMRPLKLVITRGKKGTPA